MLLKAEHSCLLVVDIQERLLPAMANPERVSANALVLIRAACRLGIPILASEQYPRGIGPLVGDIAAALPEGCIVEKLHFSCLGEPGFAERLDALARRQVVVAGIEAHVCVLQTAADLVAAGRDAFVVADATSSRTPANHTAAMTRLGAVGATIVTTEMVVFEWLERAGTPEFKALSALIK